MGRQPSTTATARLPTALRQTASSFASSQSPTTTFGEVPCSDEPGGRQEQPPRELSDDRAQPIDEADEVVTPLLSEHRQQPQRLTCVDTASTGKTGVVTGVLERERDRAAGTPADRCRKRIRSVKKLVARRD